MVDLFSEMQDKGFKCSCCGQFVKTYHRSMNSNMAICLIALVKYKVNGFVKVEDFLLEHGYKRCGDFSYLVHYRMLEKMGGKREDGSRKNGYYRITGIGIAFAEGKMQVQEKFLIQNGKFLGFEGKEINIHNALGTKFSYEKLMNEV